MGHEGEAVDVSRRTALKAGITLGVLAGLRGDQSEIGPTDKHVTSFLKDPLFETNQPRIGMNAEGLPVKCILPNGEEISLDTRRAAELQKKARRRGEPEILTVVRYKDPSTDWIPFDFEPSEQHPRVEKIPQDVLSKEALAERGVEVINTDEVQLSIRESAFAKDGPLGTLSNPKRKLTIALVDAPFILPMYLKDDRYKDIRDLLADRDEDVKDFRKELIAKLQKNVGGLKQKYHDIQSDRHIIRTQAGPVPKDEALTSAMREWAEMKGNEYAWANINPDNEVYGEMISAKRIAGDAAGLYAMKGQESILFIAAGNTLFDSAQVTIAFYPDGSCNALNTVSQGRKVNVTGDEPYNDLTPQAAQTHPDPDSFSRNPKATPLQPGSYPYGGVTPGFTLRHEAAHDELIRTHNSRSKSEYWTDERAMQGIRSAWKKWRKSGFKDDSGYSFVLQTTKAIVLT